MYEHSTLRWETLSIFIISESKISKVFLLWFDLIHDPLHALLQALPFFGRACLNLPRPAQWRYWHGKFLIIVPLLHIHTSSNLRKCLYLSRMLNKLSCSAISSAERAPTRSCLLAYTSNGTPTIFSSWGIIHKWGIWIGQLGARLNSQSSLQNWRKTLTSRISVSSVPLSRILFRSELSIT